MTNCEEDRFLLDSRPLPVTSIRAMPWVLPSIIEGRTLCGMGRESVCSRMRVLPARLWRKLCNDHAPRATLNRVAILPDAINNDMDSITVLHMAELPVIGVQNPRRRMKVAGQGKECDPEGIPSVV